MNDFLKILFLGIAVILVVNMVAQLQMRVTTLEEGASCPAGCRPMQEMLRNRPISKIHSFAKPFDVCK
jgi:hypothetical protein